MEVITDFLNGDDSKAILNNTSQIPFKTINGAIKAIMANDSDNPNSMWTIKLRSGVYQESFVLPDNIQLITDSVINFEATSPDITICSKESPKINNTKKGRNHRNKYPKYPKNRNNYFNEHYDKKYR